MALLYGTYGPDQKYVDDWKVPSNRAFMHDPADQAFWQKSSQQEASDLTNVWGGQDPFDLALSGHAGAAPSNRFPAPAAPNPVAAPAAPQPNMPPQFNASQPQPQSLWKPVPISAPAPAPQPYMPPQDNASQPQQTPTLGNNQASPVQLPGSVLGQMTPKPYQPTNFSPAPRTTQSNGGAVSGYSGNPAFAAYSRRRGL